MLRLKSLISMETRRKSAESREKRRIFKHDREEYRKLYATYNRDADIVFIGDNVTFNAPWSDFFPDQKTSNKV